MEAKKKLLTYAGLKALEEELENLKVVKRKEVAAKIKEAREQGDLSENAEYDAAKDEQRDIEARIEELEAILKNAEVVVEDEVDFDKINVGCTVKAYDITFDEEIEFKLVGSTEANSLRQRDLNNTEAVSGIGIRIIPVLRRVVGVSQRDILGRKIPVKIGQDSITNRLVIQGALPGFFAGFFQTVDAPVITDIAQRPVADLNDRGHYSPPSP